MKVTIDKAGRVVIPKPVRERLHLVPGDTLVLEADGERITLRPLHSEALFTKEHGIGVYQGEKTDVSIPMLVEQNREKRFTDLC